VEAEALYKIGYGLYVLTAQDGAKDNGCIINTLMQVTSISPHKIAITVSKENYTHDMIVKTGEFNISILTEDTPFKVFEDFGFRSGRDVDKFKGYEEITRSANGIIYLTKHTNAYISGKVISTVDIDTHTMFIALMTHGEVISDTTSVTYAYYHKNIKPKPDKSTSMGYRCRICNYIYEGEPLPEDFICPLCKHGAKDFEKILSK